MDEKVTGMQMNLFLWADNREVERKASAVVIDAVEEFEFRQGLVVGRRFLRQASGEEIHDPKDPISLKEWRCRV